MSSSGGATLEEQAVELISHDDGFCQEAKKVYI